MSSLKILVLEQCFHLQPSNMEWSQKHNFYLIFKIADFNFSVKLDLPNFL